MVRWNIFAKQTLKKYSCIFVCLFFILLQTGQAKPLQLAVASSFYKTAVQLADSFKKHTNIKIDIVFAASGVLATRYQQGAKYDFLVLADKQYVTKLKLSNYLIVAQDQVAYWYPKAKEKVTLATMKKNVQQQEVVLPNPQTAPFGAFTSQYLSKNKIKIPKYRYGMNEQTTYMLIDKGLVKQGFISMARLQRKQIAMTQWTALPVYVPLWLAILHKSKEQALFLSFLQSKEAKKILQSNQYTTNSVQSKMK